MVIKKIPVTFWLNMPSFYQVQMLEALNASGQVDVNVYFADHLSQERQALGWQSEHCTFQHAFLEGKLRTRSALRYLFTQNHERIHVVGNLWNEVSLAVVAFVVRQTGRPLFIYSEGIRPVRRPLIKTLVRRAFGLYLSNYDRAAVLAISHFSSDLYRTLGFQETKIYRYGYFKSSPLMLDNPPDLVSLRLCFIGQLIKRKGVDVLLDALLPLMSEHPELSLTIVGNGVDRIDLESHPVVQQYPNRVYFAGVVPSNQIYQWIQQADALVLPSRWDGWGIVVNEAFIMGKPVFVSNMCGASDLIRNGYNGYVFESENVISLRQALLEFIKLGPSERQALGLHASKMGNAISVDTVVPYLVNCFKHFLGNIIEKPIPPWETIYDTSNNEISYN